MEVRLLHVLRMLWWIFSYTSLIACSPDKTYHSVDFETTLGTQKQAWEELTSVVQVFFATNEQFRDSVTTSDRASISFAAYLTESEHFSHLIMMEIPDAIHSANCAMFLRSHYQAVQISNNASFTLSQVISDLTQSLVSDELRASQKEAAESSTSQYLRRLAEMLSCLLLDPAQWFKILIFDTTPWRKCGIEKEVEEHMLVSRQRMNAVMMVDKKRDAFADASRSIAHYHQRYIDRSLTLVELLERPAEGRGLTRTDVSGGDSLEVMIEHCRLPRS